jgi:hypothetical protein
MMTVEVNCVLTLLHLLHMRLDDWRQNKEFLSSFKLPFEKDQDNDFVLHRRLISTGRLIDASTYRACDALKAFQTA